MMHNEKLIIIGSGPAGLTAAIYAARAGMHPLVIEGSYPGGQLMGTTYVENWPGINRILGPDLMKNMRDHAAQFKTRFMSRSIEQVDFKRSPFQLITNKQEVLSAYSVIIASGATPKRLSVPGEDTYWGKGVTTCAVCDGAFYKNKPVVIVGGGDTAMENASFMTNFTDQITIIQNLEALTASQAMQERVLNRPNIAIRYQSTVTAITGDGKRATGVVIEDTLTGKSEELKTDVVFIAIGLRPNTAFLKDQLELYNNGYIVTSEHTKTSVPGIFAAGDVVDYRYRQAITSAGTGCMAALDAENYIKKLNLPQDTRTIY